MRACEITLNSGYSGVFQIRKINRTIIFSLSQAIEVSRHYVLPRTYTLQKTMPLAYTNLTEPQVPITLTNESSKFSLFLKFEFPVMTFWAE